MPFGLIVMSALVAVLVMADPLMLMLSTSKSVSITTVPVPFGEMVMSPLVLSLIER